jgi:hypothetical protein
MACGGRKTPPPHTCSLFVTRIHLENNVMIEIKTTSNDNLEFHIEPMTPSPQGVGTQEIVHHSLVRTHSSLARIRQPGRPINQPFDS